MLNMSIGDVIKVVDASTAAEDVVVELVDGLREAFQQWVGQCVTLRCKGLKSQAVHLNWDIFK